MAEPFKFKQFTLQQGKSAFKLGTDTVVLGSWLPGINFQRVLDIGSGTGILALMMAQRFKESVVTAIELDIGSAEDCLYNFQHSKWAARLLSVNQNIIEWSKTNPTQKFDLIITNPPYFVDSLKNPDPRKSIARHTQSLGLNDIAQLALMHLEPSGVFACILPILQFEELEKLLLSKNIHTSHICIISSYENSEPIRKMGVFTFNKHTPVIEQQFLYKKDRTRSNWYQLISDEFYIK